MSNEMVHKDQHFKELISINMSLANLGNVIQILSNNVKASKGTNGAKK